MAGPALLSPSRMGPAVSAVSLGLCCSGMGQSTEVWSQSLIFNRETICLGKLRDQDLTHSLTHSLIN